MMVTVLLSPAGACLARGFRSLIGLAGGRGCFSSAAGLAQGDLRDRLAAERIVGEKGDGREGDQEQAEQHGQRLHRGERQPKPALLALRFLSERRAQFVGRFRHEPPRINLPTIARRAGFERLRRGQKRPAPVLSGKDGSRQQKGRPEGRPFRNALKDQDQFAALVAGLSIAALSPVAGAVAVDLMPCSRSAAVFSALSSLASGGT